MFLNVTKGAIGAAKAKSISSKWDTYGEAEAELSKLGFKLPAPPRGEVPAVRAGLLENVQSAEYVSKYAELVAWISFGETLRGSYEAERLQFRNALRVIGAEVRKKAKEDNDASKGSRGWKPLAPVDVQTLLLVNSDYQEMMLRDQKLTQRIELLSGHMKGVSRAVALMSRNIELKRLELETKGGAIGRRSSVSDQPARTPGRKVPTLYPQHPLPHEEEPESEEAGEE